jgi:hypothetical protein
LPIDLAPRQPDRVGSSQTRPAEELEHQQILSRRGAQLREFIPGEWLSATLRIVPRPSIELDRILLDQLGLYGKCEDPMQNSDIEHQSPASAGEFPLAYLPEALDFESLDARAIDGG